MAMLGIKVPEEVRAKFSEISVPEKREPADEYHITLLHLGDDVPIETVAKTTIAANQVAEKMQPFQVSTRLLTSFPKNSSGVPIICAIESAALHKLHAELKAACDEHGVEYSAKFPEYKPHITLAYAPEEHPDQEIGPLSFEVSEFALLGGNKGEDKVEVRFPFQRNLTASLRVAARYQRSQYR